MRLPSTDRGAIDTLKNHLLGKQIPGAGPWGEMALLRGWKDDFLGSALHEQYEVGGLITLIDGKHGGWIRANAGTVNNTSSVLVLGATGAPNYYTLDADDGWFQIWRMQLGQITNIQAGVAAYEWTNGYRIFAGLRTDVHANNWIIRCINAAGNSFTNTGVVADINPHWHAMAVYPTAIGHQMDYWLDEALIGSHTTNIYTDPLHPILWCINRGGSVTDRTADFDYWGVVPNNL